MATVTSATSQPKGKEVPFSYAAAASGRASSKAQVNTTSTSTDSTASQSSGTESSNTSSPSSTTSTATVTVNGASKGPKLTKLTSDSPAGTSASPSVSSTLEPNGKQESAHPEESSPSSPSLESASTSTAHRDDDAISTATSAPDLISSSADHHQGGNSASNEKPVEVTPPKKELVPAPIPQVNVWKMRQASVKPKPATLTNGATVLKSELPTANMTNGAAKGTSPLETKSGRHSSQDNDKMASGNIEKREAAKERRAHAESSREKTNGVPKDEGKANKAGSKSQKGQNPSNIESISHADIISTPVLPPPLGDATLWPTPDIAVDEEKKEKKEREEKEKEKPIVTLPRGGKVDWVNVPVTPNIIYQTQIPTRGGGRGGRGGRGGSGASERGGKSHPAAPNSEKNALNSAAEGPSADAAERGRNGTAIGELRSARGGGPNKGKRTASAGESHHPRRNQSPPHSFEKRKTDMADLYATGQGAEKPRQRIRSPNKSNNITHTEKEHDIKSSKPLDDAAFVGQGVVPQASYSSSRHEKSRSLSWRNGAERQQHTNGLSQYGEASSPDTSYFNREGGFISQHPPTRERATSRGGHRGSRGGNNGFNAINGAHYSNGHPNQISHQMGIHSPASPSYSYGMQSPQFPLSPQMQQPVRGGFRNQSRNQIPPPTMPSFRGFPVQLGYPQHPSPMMYGPGVHSPYYDYPGSNLMSPSLPPIQYSQEQYDLIIAVTNQIDYYFSQDNLSHDMYLRQNMDSQGFVRLALIAGFNRMKNLCTDLNLVREGCIRASNAEFRVSPDGEGRLRAAVHPESWALDMEKRVPSAQNDGLNWYTPQPQYQNYDLPGAFLAPSNGYAPQMVLREMMPNEMVPSAEPFVPSTRQHSGFDLSAAPFVPSTSVSSEHVTPGERGADDSNRQQATAQNTQSAKTLEMTDFSDQKVDQLVLILRKSSENLPNGVDSTLKAKGDVEGLALNEQLLGMEQTAMMGIPGSAERVGDKERGFYPGSPRLSSSPRLMPQVNELGWYVDPQATHDMKPYTSTYTYYPYVSFKNATLDTRSKKGAANTTELETLYRFYSHFLRTQFNDAMYQKFKDLAIEDFAAESHMGLDYLLKLYEAKLHSLTISEVILDDFISIIAICKDKYHGAQEKLQSVLDNTEIPVANKQQLTKLIKDSASSA